MKRIKPILLLLFIITHNLAGQVTIGSGIEPSKGALLDLKEFTPTPQNATASRGLSLPKVKLTDENNLFPMFETTPGSGTANSQYNTTMLKNLEDGKHIGLTVYNLNQCNGFAKGVYIWDGEKWLLIGNGNGTLTPTIFINGEDLSANPKSVFHIPSGVDKRTFSGSQTLNISWQGPELTASFSNINHTIGGGIPFLTNPPSSWSSPLSANPTNFAFTVSDMSGLPNILTTNPWQSRETKIDFATTTNACGESTQRTVTLNQTNYAVTYNSSQTSYRQMITMIDYVTNPLGNNTLNSTIQSNASWKANYQEVTPGIIQSIGIPSKGGKELMNGTSTTGWYFPVRGTGTSNQYKVAGKLTISDSIPAPNNRFDPIEITYVQCGSRSMDMSSAANGNALPEAQWDDKVLSHTDQEGNIFYSAKFGTAGRWMITNLRAKKYATGEGGGNLITFDKDSVDAQSNSRRAYGYPRFVTSPTNEARRTVTNWGEPPEKVAGHGTTWYEEQGLLYNWYAATNQNHSYVSTPQSQLVSGLDNTPGSNEIEMIGPKGTVPNKYIQGICPDGWHLPSDREWNKLERELYNNPTKYSSLSSSQIAQFNPTSWNPAFEIQDGARGGDNTPNKPGYSNVFREVCPIREMEMSWMQTTDGYSKEPAAGGFNVILAGYGSGNWTADFGYTTRFWTSSATAEVSWLRNFNLNFGYVMRFADFRHRLHSVRCKKNE